MNPAPKWYAPPPDKRNERRAEMLHWLATSQAEREMAERLEIHRILAFGPRR